MLNGYIRRFVLVLFLGVLLLCAGCQRSSASRTVLFKNVSYMVMFDQLVYYIVTTDKMLIEAQDAEGKIVFLQNIENSDTVTGTIGEFQLKKTNFDDVLVTYTQTQKGNAPYLGQQVESFMLQMAQFFKTKTVVLPTDDT